MYSLWGKKFCNNRFIMCIYTHLNIHIQYLQYNHSIKKSNFSVLKKSHYELKVEEL